MKIIETFDELSTYEQGELRDSMKQCLRISLEACPLEYLAGYQDLSLSDYKYNMVNDIWDDNESKGEGISFQGKAILLNDETLVDIESMYEDVRDEALDTFCNDLVEEISEEFADDLTDQLKVSEDADGEEIVELPGYDFAGSDDDLGKYDKLYSLLSHYDGFTIDNLVGHLGWVKAKHNEDVLYFEKAKDTFDVVFNDETSSDSKGFKKSFEECRDYIERKNGTNESYFADYKGGIVSIVNNMTGTTVYEEFVK